MNRLFQSFSAISLLVAIAPEGESTPRCGTERWWRCAAAAAAFDEHLVVTEHDGAMGATCFPHTAAESCQITVRVHDVTFERLPGFAIESAIVEGYPHPGKIGGTTEVGPRQGILHSFGFPIAISAKFSPGAAHRAWLSIAPSTGTGPS